MMDDEIKDMILKWSGPPAEPGTIKFVGLLVHNPNIRPEERLTDEEIRQMHLANWGNVGVTWKFD